MTARPLENYRLLGTSIVLDSRKFYNASYAKNQPDWESRGLIYIHEADDEEDSIGFLLERGEYELGD
jgi:hypothetical protein